MDEEILIVITRMCFREAITCARAGIVWTRRGDDSDPGIQQDWNRKSQAFGKDMKTSQKHCNGSILYDWTDRSKQDWTGQILANNTKLLDQQNEKIEGS